MIRRDAAIAVHLLAIGTIMLALVVISMRDEHAALIWASALTGFVLGIAFDRWALRPLADLTLPRRRA